MDENGILIIRVNEVEEILNNREELIMNAVGDAYITHSRGDSTLPHSSFLRFPGDNKNRIIALPTYLGGNVKTAGIKWISSFPDNIHHGIERASAMTILNSMETGRPKAILEGSIISAKRTAASAALAATRLHETNEEVLGLVGCGLINFEILKFILSSFKQIKKILVYDLDNERMQQYIKKIQETYEIEKVEGCNCIDKIFKEAPLVSFATTAGTPYVEELPEYTVTKTILHISLRDLSPKIILQADNIVDDLSHVCRAQTSIHLTEEVVKNRDFVRGSLADILLEKIEARGENKISIFSPFGLGVLDIILAKYVYDTSIKEHKGMELLDFFK